MKTIIRSNVFETNSSSSHSISVADETKEFVLDTIYPNKEGIIELIGGEFGWDWFKHNDAITKANYAAVDLIDDGENINKLIEVIKEHTGAEEVLLSFSNSYDGPNWSYIDHDSRGIVPRDKESLKNFIFNKNSWLFGGNDNSTASPSFYDVPTYTKDGIQEVQYKYELKVDGYPNTLKFVSYPSDEQLSDAFHSLLERVYYSEDGEFDDDMSIEAQIKRDTRNQYQFSDYVKPIDTKNQVIFFVKDRWGVRDEELAYKAVKYKLNKL